MAGYDGYSMSNNAREAYDRGSMPMSKWTKKAILEQIEYEGIEVPASFNKLPLKMMKEVALKSDGWHHTSRFYNVTNFYEVDVDYLESLTEEIIVEMIEDAKAKKTYIVARYHYTFNPDAEGNAYDYDGTEETVTVAGCLKRGNFTSYLTFKIIPAGKFEIVEELKSDDEAEEWNRRNYQY